jgi:hypothetical protein
LPPKAKAVRRARVITYVYVARTTVYLLAIYDKSDQDAISDKELKELDPSSDMVNYKFNPFSKTVSKHN